MITLSTGSLYPYGLSRIFEIAEKTGFEGVELMLRSKTENAFYDSWDINYVKSLSKKYSLVVNSLHYPFEFEDNPDNFDEIFNIAKKLDCKYIIVHIPRKDQTNFKKWFDEFSKQKHQITPKILFENLYFSEKKEDPIIGHESLHILEDVCFDIAHALRSNVDVENLIPKLSNVRQFHVSNWDGKEDHMSITSNTKLFRNLLGKTDADLCLELCPEAFFNVSNMKKTIEELKSNLAVISKNI